MNESQNLLSFSAMLRRSILTNETLAGQCHWWLFPVRAVH